MARIGENAFRQYRDGQDRLTAPEYMAERELIRLAVNDLDDKVERTESIREEFVNTVNEVEGVKGDIVQTKQEMETRIGEFSQTIDQTTQELQSKASKEEVNTVSALLVERGRQIGHNPVEYGADATGISYSDNALTTLISVLADGDRIVFPKGVYRFQKTVTITKNVEIDFNMSEFIFESTNGFSFKGTKKTTVTATADYIESTSKNSLALSSTIDIQKDDLLNINSTDLYNRTRYYYYKGGNALVTGIRGSDVFFNLTFPFDMQSSTITVDVYKPITVALKNIKSLVSTKNTRDSYAGISIQYGANIRVENVHGSNFQRILEFYRCVNVTGDSIITGHAKDPQAENSTDWYDGYGIYVGSCTNITLNHITTNSGQHGITTSGREPNFGVVINDSVLKAEIWNHGIGMHQNIFDVTINNTISYGGVFAGVCVLNNCKILNSENGSHLRLSMSHDNRYANYTFNGCIIEPPIDVRDNYQIYDPTTDKIGKIILTDIPRVDIAPLVKSASTEDSIKVLTVDFLKIVRSSYRISMRDKVNKIIIEDCTPIDLEGATFNQISNKGTYEKIGEIHIIRSQFTNRYTDLHIRKADRLFLDNVVITSLGADNGTGAWLISDIGELHMNNVDMSNSDRGFTNGTTAIGKVSILGGKIKFRTAGIRTDIIRNSANVNIQGMIDILANNEFANYLTGANGSKYKQVVDIDGNLTLTVV